MAVVHQPETLGDPRSAWQMAAVDLEEMLDLAADAIVLLSADQRIVRFNRAATRLFGYASDEVLGQPLDILLPERYAEVHTRHVQDFAAGSETSRHMADRKPLIARRKDGQEFPVEISIARQEREGRVTFGAIVHDLTVQQKAEQALRQSEALYRSVVSALTEGVLLFDAEGVIRACNLSARKILGLAEKDIIGQSYAAWQMIRPDGAPYPNGIQPVEVTLRTGRPRADVVMGLPHPDGAVTWLSLNSQPFAPAAAPQPYAVVASFADITEPFELYRRLEQRVQERTREIERRRQVADDLREILTILNSNQSLDEILTHIVSQARREFGADACAVFRLQDDGQTLAVQASEGLPCDLARYITLPLTHTSLAQTLADRRPLLVADPASLFPSASPTAGGGEAIAADANLEGYKSVLLVPLFIHDEFYGEIGLCFGQPRTITAEELHVAEMIGNQAALAIENAGLHAKVQAMAALEERQKLARELHDSVSQVLYGIALSARTADGFLRSDPARASEALRYCLSLADAGLTEMRALILELRPELLEAEGLVAAIRKYAAALQARHGLKFELDLGDEPGIDLHVKEALYRMTQEAFHNVLRHAQAKHVTMQLEVGDRDICWEVRDDGRGFDPADPFPGHMGLQSMRERVERAGGTWEVKSAPGAGTTLRAALPRVGRPESLPYRGGT